LITISGHGLSIEEKWKALKKNGPNQQRDFEMETEAEETHKFKRIETKTYKATLFRPERMRIVLLCSDCGKIKVVDL
jgi:hypothetical protein